ncbi:hypothetical protein Bccel_4705 [Pseudobacteroides cellulosolvens ATCC 35603 = DSM 2933]|uniref:Uncharacterized protein n=2 Tax=Pseudobacteroides cellulosolvens TaxID=35825 RepID=A0A0L6JU97_9FIRM|nr:hypothetical protein Bccel_4705 [Pseudobacteroides cellulosolvens ATCC 35603 = DSM 2933]
MLVFPVGLFLLIEVNLTDASSAAALDQAIVYELDGNPVASMVVKVFSASETGSEGTSGSNYYKIQAIDLKKGTLIFDKKMKGSYSTYHDPKILGSLKDNLFIFHDGRILVIDKFSGKTVHSINSVGDSDEVSLLPEPEMCKFDNTTKSIVFKANNGLVYSLNMQDLGISEKKSIDIDKYFTKEKNTFTTKYLGKGMSIIKASEKGMFNIFLTDSDINNLKEGLEVSSSVENTERRYLYNGSLDNVMGLKKLTQEVFLLGGFLFNQVSNDKYFYDNIGIDPQNKNFKNYVNLSGRGESKALEPFKTEGSNLSLIVHKKSLDSGANTLLTAINLQEGKSTWSIDTGASEIHECYNIDKDHIMLFCQDGYNTMGQNFSTNFILYVSLKDGTCTGFDVKYSRSFKF